MKKKELEYELGRYRKKVADQQREINILKQKLAAAELSGSMSEAFLALMLEKSGRGKVNPVRVCTEEIGMAVKAEMRPVFERMKDSSELLMWYQKAE